MNELVSGLTGCLSWEPRGLRGRLEGEERMTSIWGSGVVWGTFQTTSAQVGQGWRCVDGARTWWSELREWLTVSMEKGT